MRGCLGGTNPRQAFAIQAAATDGGPAGAGRWGLGGATNRRIDETTRKRGGGGGGNNPGGEGKRRGCVPKVFWEILGLIGLNFGDRMV